MERLDNLMTSSERPTAKAKTTRTKRKWREIEALKDKFRLKQELQDIDWTHDLATEDLDF